MTRKFAIIPFALLAIVVVLSFIFPGLPSQTLSMTSISSGDTAWMLMATALVLIMTPGLAYFYGGMVRNKNVISTMLQSFICMVIITILWIVVGFSLTFGEDIGGIIGNPATFFMFQNVLGGEPWAAAPTIPFILFALFQLKFAIITPALITGAFAERIKFTAYLLFVVLFSLFIYIPLAHATWHPQGILAQMGVLDFAGGTVVHMSAGLAALVCALYLKKRHEIVHKPAHISYVILGTALLWFGWFGFNAGSAYKADIIAASALATTTCASAAAAFTWIIFDALRGHKPSAMGTCIGTVVGLVAITPAAGFVSVPHSLVIGILSSLVCNLMVQWRTRTGIDDTLDVFPCHGVGGMMGMILTGVFAHGAINPVVTSNGLAFGDTALFTAHMIALVGVSVFVIAGTWILLKVTEFFIPLRVSVEEEMKGLDESQHGEVMAPAAAA